MTIITAPNLANIPDSLRTPAAPVADVASVAALYEEFMQTLHDSGGIGLAAPQVGLSLRFFAVHYEPEKDEETPKLPLTFLINPEIVKRSEKTIQWREGCLSLPGYTGATQRAKEVKVKGLNRFGKEVTVKASGLYACALQHEIDHLNGVLFTDHATEVRLETPEEAAEDSIIE
jgi:peptide deformylase